MMPDKPVAQKSFLPKYAGICIKDMVCRTIIKTIYKYTSGKVKNVGRQHLQMAAQFMNTEVTLKCATEGATILYSTDDGQIGRVHKKNCVVQNTNDVQRSKSSQRRI